MVPGCQRAGSGSVQPEMHPGPIRMNDLSPRPSPVPRPLVLLSKKHKGIFAHVEYIIILD